MLVSYYTPTHTNNWLMEAYESLDKQTEKEWQWVVMAYPGVSLPSVIKEDRRVKVITPKIVGKTTIGEVKALACSNCDGRLLAELDQDDFLVGEATEKIVEEWKKTGAGFMYSDCVDLNFDGTTRVYGKQHGWETGSLLFEEIEYLYNKSFLVTPSSLRDANFMPNHIRVWSRECYEKSGGYNKSQDMNEDQELIIRTYLTGDKFHHIQEPLYFYRVHPGNICKLKNAEGKEEDKKLAKIYAEDLIEEWCKREGLHRIVLESTIQPQHISEGWRRFNKLVEDRIDVVVRGIPLPNDSVGIIKAENYLQTVSNERVIPLMNELYRVLAPGGSLIVKVPSTDGRAAFQDPTAKSYWNENSFWYYTKKIQAQSVSDVKAKFQTITSKTEYPNDWYRDRKMLYTYVELVALKGQRQPGMVEV